MSAQVEGGVVVGGTAGAVLTLRGFVTVTFHTFSLPNLITQIIHSTWLAQDPRRQSILRQREAQRMKEVTTDAPFTLPSP